MTRGQHGSSFRNGRQATEISIAGSLVRCAPTSVGDTKNIPGFAAVPQGKRAPIYMCCCLQVGLHPRVRRLLHSMNVKRFLFKARSTIQDTNEGQGTAPDPKP